MSCKYPAAGSRTSGPVDGTTDLGRLSLSMEKNVVPAVPYSYLYADGLVVDRQPVRVVSSCELSVYTFPFDIQTCTLSFNSYSLRGE